MSAPVAFYAPLKPPDHPVPSGDRRMARALIAALKLADCPVELASRLRSYDRDGDALRQRRIAALGGRIAARLVRRYAGRPAAERPRAWLTYHAYHKSPDWLGPAVTAPLAITYLLAEASFAPKQEGGAWAPGHAATARAIRAADVVLALTAIDAECLAPLVAAPAELRRLPPFVDPAPGRAARGERARHRAALAPRFGLDPQQPWLLTVAMMRADAKRESYALLARALAPVRDLRWQLLVVGDGPARAEVAALLRTLGADRVRLAGLLPEEALPAVYAAADLYVWPAVREAYGLAMLEAQAAGLPVVAGAEGGVAEVVADGRSGVLTAPRAPDAFSGAVRELLEHPERRHAMAEAAVKFVVEERSIGRAAAELSAALAAADAIRARRR
jgi:glycosyltransferase involved in cell wall biosynthesis